MTEKEKLDRIPKAADSQKEQNDSRPVNQPDSHQMTPASMELEFHRRRSGQLYNPLGVGDSNWIKCRNLLPQLNATRSPDEARPLLKALLGKFPDSAHVVTPFYCDLGAQIEMAEHSFINMDCLFLDEATISIGEYSMIGPRCSFYTADHPMDPAIRQTGVEKALPIVIEDNVWIGGGCTINPGVTIHAGSVIGSGSVVTRDIPAGVLAAGNPCRVIRKLTEEERQAEREDYADYLADRANLPVS